MKFSKRIVLGIVMTVVIGPPATDAAQREGRASRPSRSGPANAGAPKTRSVPPPKIQPAKEASSNAPIVDTVDKDEEKWREYCADPSRKRRPTPPNQPPRSFDPIHECSEATSR
jgi:hypothetical protein